jgi:hypothetical protein
MGIGLICVGSRLMGKRYCAGNGVLYEAKINGKSEVN